MKNRNIILTLIFCLALFAVSCSTSSKYTTRVVDINTSNIETTPTVVDVKVDLNKRVEAKSEFRQLYSEALQEANYRCIIENKIDIVVDPIYMTTYKGKKYQVQVSGFSGYYENPRTFYEDINLLKSINIDEVKKYLIIHQPQLLMPENDNKYYSIPIKEFIDKE